MAPPGDDAVDQKDWRADPWICTGDGALLDGPYRYWLTRRLHGAQGGRKRIAFIMLNPSTATACDDDPTVRRCLDFGNRLGARHLALVNLFAYRATQPRWLREVADPIGPRNDDTLAATVAGADLLIAAWGAHPIARARVPAIMALAVRARRALCTLGELTKCGAPRHPLRLRRDTPLCVMPQMLGERRGGF